VPEDALGEFMARSDHNPIMIFIIILIVCLLGIAGFFVYHGSENVVRRRGTKRGRSRYSYPAEQEMNIRSIEFTQIAPTEDQFEDDEPL
jgi:hypothetical protein